MRYLLLVSAMLISSCAFLPTAAPEIVRETVEVTREVLVTAEPQPTATFTPLPPAILEENFEQGGGEWSTGEFSESASEIAGGQLLISVSSPNFVHTVAHPELDFLNTAFDLTVDMEHQSGSTLSYGSIDFRYFDEDNFVEFAIDGDGFMSFGVFLDGEYFEIVPWTRVSAVSKSTNTVRLIDYGDAVSIRVNGELVIEMPLEDLDPGSIGLSVTTFDEGGAEWAYDNLILREVR